MSGSPKSQTVVRPREAPLKRARTSVKRFGNRIRRGVEAWLERKSFVEGHEIIQSDAFPWVAELEANWRTIRGELENVIAVRSELPNMQDLSPVQYNVTQDKVWKVFAFRAYGARIERNCQSCPETARLIDAIPEVEVAFFSVLEPGAHLAAHKGSYKGLIRAHLGLIVPEPRSLVRMQVGRETVFWEEGRCVVFDDTYRHEIWNDTSGVRVVLLIDVPRPLPPALAAVNKAILRLARVMPFVTSGVRRLKSWEKTFYAAHPERLR